MGYRQMEAKFKNTFVITFRKLGIMLTKEGQSKQPKLFQYIPNSSRSLKSTETVQIAHFDKIFYSIANFIGSGFNIHWKNKIFIN